ncbi:hypothetical protein DACRYDRAFT_100140 [Dacryopinax primogenitus]|uniref:C2H2-type domain-containing protein n=1 Tax=Dacryopinax primogenitus (strain DJM 731) TaxID=1858805 RepID=M5FVK4_DACPD|nr:uncharacterized protein DACRYDRAFT_100140 [Dacryopinax primogenitus]EJU01851.1 hypothetical protein DACRYDRAFT_100140 [Dacryopinax primogenitus]
MPHPYAQFEPFPTAFDFQSALKQQSPLRDPTIAFPERASPLGSSFPNSSPRISESSSRGTPLYSPAMSLSTPFDAFLEPDLFQSPTPPQAPAPFQFPHAQLTADGHGLILPADPNTAQYQVNGYPSAIAGAFYDPFATLPLTAYAPEQVQDLALHLQMQTTPLQPPYPGLISAGSLSPTSSFDSPLLSALASPQRHASLPALSQPGLTAPFPHPPSPPKKRRSFSHSHASALPVSSSEEDDLTRAKIHVCPVCARCFSRSHDMRRHIRGHNEGSHHKCDACGRGFRRLDAVKRHLRTACQGHQR